MYIKYDLKNKLQFYQLFTLPKLKAQLSFPKHLLSGLGLSVSLSIRKLITSFTYFLELLGIFQLYVLIYFSLVDKLNDFVCFITFHRIETDIS